MGMAVTQVRLPKGLTDEIDKLVTKKIYANRSEAIRAGVRMLAMERYSGIIQSNTNSVDEVREIRKKLTKKDLKLEELNALVGK